MIRGHYFYVHLRTRIVSPLAPVLSFKLKVSSNPRNPDHWKNSGSHGKIESIQRRNYSDQPLETVSRVEYEQKKGVNAVEPRMESSWQRKNFIIGTTVPNKKKKKKRREQVYRYIFKVYRYTLRKKGQWLKCTGTPSKCTGTPYEKSGSSQSVPVHH